MTPIETQIAELSDLIENTFDFNEDDCEDADFEATFVCDYLPRFKTLCENTNNISSCLLIIWIFRSLLLQVELILF